MFNSSSFKKKLIEDSIKVKYLTDRWIAPSVRSDWPVKVGVLLGSHLLTFFVDILRGVFRVFFLVIHQVANAPYLSTVLYILR